MSFKAHFHSVNLAELLHSFFDELYNNDIVSDEAFEAWEKCDDPAEQESTTSMSRVSILTHFSQ